MTPPAARGVARDLLRGSAIYAIPNFGIKALNFLLLPLYTRFLTPGDYGAISLAETLAAIVGILGGLGMSGAMARLYFQYLDDAPALRRYLSSVLRFGLLVLGATLALALAAGPYLLAVLLPRFSVPFYPFLGLALVAAAAQQVLDYRLVLYQVQRRPGRFAALAILTFVATTALAITFVVGMRGGARGMLLGKAAAGAAAAMVAMLLLAKWLRGGWQWRPVRDSLGLALPLVPQAFMAAGLVAADRLILERYRDLHEVGLYSLAYSLGMVMYLATVSVMQAWNPIFFEVARQGDAARATLGRISTGLAFGLLAVATLGSVVARDFVQWFFDARYAEAGGLVPWIIGGYFFHALFSLFHVAAIQGKRTDLLLKASLVAFAANLALNFALIPRWGMYGAAWATIVAYAVEAVVMYGYAQRVFALPYRTARLAMGTALYLAVLMVTQLPLAGAPRVVALGVGFVVVAAALLLLGGRDLRQGLTLWRRPA